MTDPTSPSSTSPSEPTSAGNDRVGERVVDRLVDRVPSGRRPSDDEMLDEFLGWIDSRGLSLYPAQEEAIVELFAGRHVILATPTGSGKSMVAIAALFRALCLGEHGWYTAPIKALVSEKFFELCEIFGPENVGMLTGDASINHGAPIVCATAEVLANVALAEGETARVEHVVMDEFHYFADRDRGWAWQVPLLTMPQTTFLLMSATIGDTSAFERRIPELTRGRALSVVSSEDRPVPLAFEWSEEPLHEAVVRLVQEGRAPVYVVSFSQREAADLAGDLVNMAVTSRDERQALLTALHGTRFDSVYGKDVQRFVKAGVGVHHAGLLPKYRLLVERLAQKGLLKVVSGTDTLGIGINVPIRSVLFTKLSKYDGTGSAVLAVRDFKQIAGRAGRKGFDDRGWVIAQAPEHVIENKRLEIKEKASGGKKKFPRKKPPEHGYVHYDEAVFRKLREGRPETLVSKMKVSHGMMLELLQRPSARGDRSGGYGALVRLLRSSFESSGRVTRLLREAAALFKALRAAGVVELVAREPNRAGARGRVVALDATLQRDFSLMHSVSLWVVETLAALDPDAEDYALDVLTLVESVIENPRPVLEAQERKVKNDLVARLKAEGVEYEARMAELDRATYPKPRADFVYDTFNAFAAHHPWVGTENIRPKSVARDMVERYASFNEYVAAYGLARVEGVLLRYLAEAYKTLVQTVPDAYKSERVLDVAAFLRSTIARVDASLVQEWEKLRAAPGAGGVSDVASVPSEVGEEASGRAARGIDIALDPRALASLVRAEMHRFTRALAQGDLEEALAGVRDDEGDPWTIERLAAVMATHDAEVGAVTFDARARLSDKTHIRKLDDRRYDVLHTLCDASGEDAWVVEGRVDLDVEQDKPGMLVELVDVRRA